MASLASQLFDSGELVNDTAWAKAKASYEAKGMSAAEIDKYRKAYQQKKAKGAVNVLASGSKSK
jgi:hypothetical protein